MRKISNEEFDKKITGRKLKRIDPYAGSQVKIRFLCLKENCGYIWSAIPSNIVCGSGCPKCSGHGRFLIQI